jgi:hypothetical protein
VGGDEVLLDDARPGPRHLRRRRPGPPSTPPARASRPRRRRSPR